MLSVYQEWSFLQVGENTKIEEYRSLTSLTTFVSTVVLPVFLAPHKNVKAQSEGKCDGVSGSSIKSFQAGFGSGFIGTFI